MGEARHKADRAVQETARALHVETPGGRIHVRGDGQSAATPFGPMAFFIEFLMRTGLYAKWIETCPLSDHGPHRSQLSDIVGPWLLSALSGHTRYAPSTTLRADGVLPARLGMTRTVSEDTVRRALSAIEDDAGRPWRQAPLDHTAWPWLTTPWILDVDVTVKPLSGHQEGAVLGDTPKKPGRPSQTDHTDHMAGLRLVLGVDVEAGNQSHANVRRPGVLKLIARLSLDTRPRCVRGDGGFGHDALMVA